MNYRVGVKHTLHGTEVQSMNFNEYINLLYLWNDGKDVLINGKAIAWEWIERITAIQEQLNVNKN